MIEINILTLTTGQTAIPADLVVEDMHSYNVYTYTYYTYITY